MEDFPWQDMDVSSLSHEHRLGVARLRTSSSCFRLGMIVLLVTFLILCSGWESLNPTEYGLIQNDWTGVVNMSPVYRSGLHYIWPWNVFVRFPASQVNIQFSAMRHSQGPPVQTRTGAEVENDLASGGQPVNISFAFQFKFVPHDLGKVYTDFGTAYQDRFDLISRNAIAIQAQLYSPEKFWTQRTTVVVPGMLAALKSAMFFEGHVEVTDFQMLRVDFPRSFGDQITLYQLKVQQHVTQQYQQQVTKTNNFQKIMAAKNRAKITQISAAAMANATLVINLAQSNGFIHVQQQKAESCTSLAKALSFSVDAVISYVKLKAVSSNGNLVVGMPGEVP